MAFITAGMGGGTGTGAAPVIAKMAREKGILTVGVVTKPFHFEGARRMRLAEAGLQALQEQVDTLIVIPNQNLFRIANEKTTFADAFAMADRVLHSGVRGITDLMVMPGLINLDFADVKTVIMEMGKAMMGTGESEGDNRALEAAESAIANPLLDDVSLKGAKGVLINITGGMDMTLFEVDEAANRIRNEVDPDANIIVGSTFDEELNGRLRVSVFATGIDATMVHEAVPAPSVAASILSAPVRVAVPEPQPQPVVAEAMAPVSAEVIEMLQRSAEPRSEPEEEVVIKHAVAEEREPEATIEEPAAAVEPAPIIEEEREEAIVVATPRIPETPFVAPRAFAVEQQEVPARAEAFVEPAQHREEKKRGPSLFDRLTGRGARGGEERGRREPDFPKTARPAPQAPARLREEQRLDLGDAEESDYDEQLEIPAFLRRQAN